MNEMKSKCPTPETIFKYFYRELDRSAIREMEEHFCQCSQCIEEIDYYKTFAEQIFLSARVQKELWLNSNTDMFFVAAADSYNNTEISEIKSSNGKYILQKIPYLEDEHVSLLVIKLSDTSINGKLSLYNMSNSSPVLIGSALIDTENKVCFDIDSDTQLKNLLITVI